MRTKRRWGGGAGGARTRTLLTPVSDKMAGDKAYLMGRAADCIRNICSSVTRPQPRLRQLLKFRQTPSEASVTNRHGIAR
ncbi:hypothetical protein J6590_054000 [Homalodisca vitripennis]|nr:hypothetical protein J6590_054000 [Homalodisca vitripennis]